MLNFVHHLLGTHLIGRVEYHVTVNSQSELCYQVHERETRATVNSSICFDRH